MSQANPTDPEPYRSVVEIRAFTEPAPKRPGRRSAQRKRKRKRRRRRPRTHPKAERFIVFDTETTTDTRQQLLFGWYRVLKRTRSGSLLCIEEGLFYGDDLATRDPAGFAQIEEYTLSHPTEADGPGTKIIPCCSRAEFVEDVLWRNGHLHPDGAVVVGFNLPFDEARLAADWTEGKGRYRGAYSLILSKTDKGDNKYRPHLRVKFIDNKLSFMDSTWPGGEGPKGRGLAFVDLRTLVHGLTDESHSLESACQRFDLPFKKAHVERYGVIDAEFIDYARQDVRATAALLETLLKELDRHGLGLHPSDVYSPATLAKAYLKAMGLRPPRDKFKGVTQEMLGWAMSAYFGGWVEVHARRVVVPVMYLDFVSMYPTVCTLLGLWDLITAADLDVVDTTQQVQQLLESVDVDHCFDPALWRQLTGFALVQLDRVAGPDTDILPVRAPYGESDAHTIGVNPLISPSQPLWFTISDLIASKLRTGRSPHVLKAWSLVGMGKQEGLRPVRLRGIVPIDPSTGDFFKAAIEERKSPTVRGSQEEVERNGQVLKTVANSGAYGVFAEMDPADAAPRESVRVHVHGLHDRFDAFTTKPEGPGPFFFSPFAALVTGAARLMLSVAHACVREHGGTHAFGDTDSLAVIATETGGLVPCPGGDERMADGSQAVRALSWDEVRAIVARFAQLNPYDPAKVPGSILEIEKENFAERGGTLRQLYALPISVKRYALFNLEPGGGFRIRKWSEHGLGHLLNPTDPDSDDREWIRQLWEMMIAEALGLTTHRPDWFDLPAVSRLAITSPKQLRTLVADGADVWPFSFMMQAHVAPNGFPADVDRTRFQLIAPYDPDPRGWLRCRWIDSHSGQRFPVCTGAEEHAYRPDHARLLTYGEVYEAYRVHPEPKSLGPDGEVCGPETVGLLQPRPVELLWVEYLGKETNLQEQVERGGLTDLDEVQERYLDPKYDPWTTAILPILREIPTEELITATRLTPRQVRNILKGTSRPRAWRRARLRRLAIDWANRPTARGLTIESDARTMATRRVAEDGNFAAEST